MEDPTTANFANDDDAFHSFETVGGVTASDYRMGEILSNSNALGTNQVGLDTGPLGPGINVFNIGGYYKLPMMDEKLKIKIDYYTVKVNETAAGVDDGVGNEIDITLKYKHSDNVHAAVGYATLSPDKQFAGNGTTIAGSYGAAVAAGIKD